MKKLKSAIFGFFILLLQAANTPALAQFDSGGMIVSAVEYLEADQYDKAEAVLKEILEEDNTCDAAWYYLAILNIVNSDIEMAEGCLQAAVALDPSNFWYRYKLAALYALTSRQELTIDMYEKLLKDFPKKSDLYFDLVELYSSQGDYEKALSTIKEIETVFGMTESIVIYRFNLLMRIGRQGEAYDSLEEYNRKYSSPYVMTALADQHLSEYRDSIALNYYDEALEMAPDYAPATIGKAEVYRMTMRYDDYFNQLEEYVALDTESAEAKCNYLSALLKRVDGKFLARFSDCLDSVIEKTLDVHPSDSNMLSLAGLYYLSTGRQDEAKTRFSRNVEAHPESLSATADYMEFLMYTDSWEDLSLEGQKAYEKFPEEVIFLQMATIGEQQLEHYDNVIQLCDRILSREQADTSSVVGALLAKGDVYYFSGESKKAYKAYEKALKLDPDNAAVLNNYAYYLCENGEKLKKAYVMSSRAVELEPDNATYLDTIGWILYCMGKPEEAKPHFKRAMLYGGKDSPVILDHYAEVLFALGEHSMAMVYWDKALRINNGEIKDLDIKIGLRKRQIEKKQ